MDVYLVKLIDPEDENYSCEYTVLSTSEEAARAFAEEQNPGKKCVSATRQS